MKIPKIEWLFAPDSMLSGESILCLIDDALVEGVVVFNAKDMTVTMSRPINGKREETHIWKRAPRIFTEGPMPNSPLSASGLETAKAMLVHLYSTS